MKKYFFAACMSFFCTFGFANAPHCPNALPTNDANFCPTFKAAAKCHCMNSGLPGKMCDNMKMLYKRLMDVFHSLDRVCESQKYATKQQCMDDWNCYRLGGTDSQGKSCSSTNLSCE